ncbi:MAG: hypothetical protein ACM3NH_04975 [Candidatus Saccharibacteria bacterium]
MDPVKRRRIEYLHHQMNEAIREAMKSANGQWLQSGEKFRFICEHGSHFHVVDGTITGIELSDEGGLQIEVSNRTMWGRPIMYLAFTKERGWSIRLKLPAPTKSEMEVEGSGERHVAESYFDGYFEAWSSS